MTMLAIKAIKAMMAMMAIKAMMTMVAMMVMMAMLTMMTMMEMTAGVLFKKSLLVLPVYRHLATTVGLQPHFPHYHHLPF